MPKLSKQVSFIVAQARDEASDLRSPAVEAEHMLLAISSQEANLGREVLLEFGLDHDALVRALNEEARQSLSAVGLDVDTAGQLDWSSNANKTPGWGTSAKLMLERAAVLATTRGDRQIGPLHLLLAALKAQEGTVPRMLSAIEVDQTALFRRTEQALLQEPMKK